MKMLLTFLGGSGTVNHVNPVLTLIVDVLNIEVVKNVLMDMPKLIKVPPLTILLSKMKDTVLVFNVLL